MNQANIAKPIKDADSVFGITFGEVAEWSNALDLKSSVPKGTVGSNPTLSVCALLSLTQMNHKQQVFNGWHYRE